MSDVGKRAGGEDWKWWGVVAIKSSVVRMNLTEVTFGRRLRRQEAATSMSGRRASHGQKVGEGVPQRTSGHRVAGRYVRHKARSCRGDRPLR